MTNRDSADRGELLPLPKPDKSWGGWKRQMQAYARANVERALAESRAEVERLRELAKSYARGHYEADARAERLVEALRDLLEEATDRIDTSRSSAGTIVEVVERARTALNLEPK